jgi:hypothetical protein
MVQLDEQEGLRRGHLRGREREWLAGGRERWVAGGRERMVGVGLTSRRVSDGDTCERERERGGGRERENGGGRDMGGEREVGRGGKWARAEQRVGVEGHSLSLSVSLSLLRSRNSVAGERGTYC